MKMIRKLFLYLFSILILGFIFRGFIYRALVTYKPLSERKNYDVQNKILIEYINENDDDTKPDIDDVVKLSLKLTSDKLNFVFAKNDNDPNALINSKKAHCVGYAAFFSTSCNYLIDKHYLEGWHATPSVGNIYFLRINIHPYFSSAFFKDHDFVIISNEITGERIAVDPTAADYLWVNEVRIK